MALFFSPKLVFVLVFLLLSVRAKSNLWICLALAASAAAVEQVPIVSVSPVPSSNRYFDHFRTRRDILRNNSAYNRSREISAAFRTYHGPYQDAAKSKSLGVDDIVILMVYVQQDESVSPSASSLAMMQNTQCHLARHGLKAVLALTRNYFQLPDHDHGNPKNQNHYNISADEMFVDNDTFSLMPYPDEFFWDTMLTLRYWNKNFVKQQKSYPTFGEYVDLIKMMAVLELLLAGKHVFLLDDDVLLIRNPIPFIIGNADIVAMEEKRSCNLNDRPIMQNEAVEGIMHDHSPEINFGFILMRSTQANIAAIREKWLVIPASNGNFGKSFKTFVHRVYEPCSSCKFRSFGNVSHLSGTPANHSSGNKPTICILSNTLFQNGFINGPQCGHYSADPTYSLVLAEEIASLRNFILPNNTFSKV
jgi:hypothetical protein